MMLMDMGGMPAEQGYGHKSSYYSPPPPAFSPYHKVQSHVVPRFPPRPLEEQPNTSMPNTAITVSLVELRVGGWSSPPGTDMILRVQPLVRKMAIELSTLDMGLYKISLDFADITSLSLIEAEALGKVEMVLGREPQKYRGAVVSYPHREVMWTQEHDAPSSPYGGPVIILIGRKESLLETYRYLIGLDVGIKNAYQHPSSPSSLHTSSLGSSTQSMHVPHLSPPHSPHISYAPQPPMQGANPGLHYQPYPMQSLNDELNAARFKPAEFNAKRLRIGSWEKKSYFSGDLKVKFLYVKKRMVWEILDVFGLTKIEILFKDITSLTVQQFPSEACMVVDVAKLPFFYNGYPQKMKNTRWEHTSDMTNGQASVCRTHVLYLPKNALGTHIEKLIQSDSHMRKVTSHSAGASAHGYAQGGSHAQFTHTFTPANMNAHLLKSAQQSNSGNASPTESARASCKCAGGCGKGCSCMTDGLWCDASCGCGGGAKRSGAVCGNPTNLKLTNCARHSLLSPAHAHAQTHIHTHTGDSPASPHSAPASPDTAHAHHHPDPNKLFKLPCKCASATLSDLVSEHECAECGTQFFYSFCFQCVVPVGAIWHCDVCGECRDSREFHCASCGKCSYSSPNGGCRNCAASAQQPASWERGDCVIC